MDEKLMICSQCNQEIVEGKYYLIFKVVVNTEEKEYEIGIQRMLSDLNDYIMQKYYHLSASEIILLRSDIVLEFLRETYKDEVILEWHLDAYAICHDCYEVYKELIPLV
jgi:hypothetical protein